jgi:type I restriction enzyme S subunit
LNSPEGKAQVAFQQGGLAQQHYNVGALKRLKVPLPSLGEQTAISDILQEVENKLQMAERKETKLRQLFMELLDELVAGTIRVDNSRLMVTVDA